MINFSTSDWLTITGIGVAILIALGARRPPKKSVKLEITDLTQPEHLPLFQVRNDGELVTHVKEAAIVSWKKGQKEPDVLPLKPTAAAEMAAGGTRMPRLDRPLSNGGFVELAFTSQEDIQSAVRMEFWLKAKRKAYLRLTMTHAKKPILHRIRFKA